MHIRQRVSHFLATLQHCLLHSVQALPSLVTDEHRRIIERLEVIGVATHVPLPFASPLGGRPPHDRRKIARAYIAKATLG